LLALERAIPLRSIGVEFDLDPEGEFALHVGSRTHSGVIDDGYFYGRNTDPSYPEFTLHPS
jgi:hypothetical protein